MVGNPLPTSSRDAGMPLCDVQWVLGHARLSSTQLYLSPLPQDVIAGVLAFHQRRAGQPGTTPPTAGAYRAESLDVLFGQGQW